jgi:hypothetical protein
MENITFAVPKRVKNDLTLIHNGLFRDDRLSYGAKGLLYQLLYLGSGVRTQTLTTLAEVSSSTVSEVRGWVGELIKVGYIKITNDIDYYKGSVQVLHVEEQPTESAVVKRSKQINDKIKEVFERWWLSYPARKIGNESATRGDKIAAFKEFKRVTESEYEDLFRATKNYADGGRIPVDAVRFLRNGYWKQYISGEEEKGVVVGKVQRDNGSGGISSKGNKQGHALIDLLGTDGGRIEGPAADDNADTGVDLYGEW